MASADPALDSNCDHPTVAVGHDLARATARLGSRLPPSLRGLARLAYNYRWTWLPDGPELFRSIDPLRFERCAANPVRLLEEANPERIEASAADPEFVA